MVFRKDIVVGRSLTTGSMTTAQRLAFSPSDGTTVYDSDLNKFFKREGGLWSEFSTAQPSESVNDTAHGFVVGDVIHTSAAGSLRNKLDGISSADYVGSFVGKVGIVSEVIDANNYVLTYEGDVTVTGHGLTVGRPSFAVPGTVGLVTDFRSSQYYQYLAIPLDANTLSVKSSPILSNTGSIATYNVNNDAETLELDHNQSQYHAISIFSGVPVNTLTVNVPGPGANVTEFLFLTFKNGGVSTTAVTFDTDVKLEGASVGTVDIPANSKTYYAYVVRDGNSADWNITLTNLPGLAVSQTLIPDWQPNTDYLQNQVVKYAHANTSTIYLRAIADNTSRPTMDVTEVSRWVLVSQDFVGGWSASEPRWQGMQINSASLTLEANDTGVNESFFSGATATQYDRISQNGFTGWSNSTAFFEGQVIRLNMGGASNVQISSNSSRTSVPGTFDLTEAANWTFVYQPTIPEWQSGEIYLAGFQVRYQGQLLQRISTGASGLSFTDTESTNWTTVVEGFPEHGVFINTTVADQGQGTYKLSAPAADCIFQLRDLATPNNEGMRIVTNWGNDGSGNSVLIRPGSGESINDQAADTDFDLTNYPVGTMVAIQSDSATSWSIKVLGQATEGDNLSWKHFSWTDQAGTSGAPFNYTTTSGKDENGKITHVANSGEITFKKGRYMVNVSLTFKVASTGSAAINIVDGSIPGRALDTNLDQLYIQSTGQPANAHDRTRMFVFDVTEDGHTFGLERVTASGNGNTTGEIMVLELPSQQSLTAGSVKASKIGHAHFKQTTRQTNVNNGLLYEFAEAELSNTSDGNIIKSSNTEVVLKANHSYKITTKVAINNSGTSQANLKLLLDGVDLLPGNNEDGLAFSITGTSTYSSFGDVVYFVDASVSDRTLTMSGNNNTPGADIVVPNTVIEMQPTHSAVIPESVEVTPIGRAFFKRTGTSAAFTAGSSAPIGDAGTFVTNTSRFSFNAATNEITIQPGSRVRLVAGGGAFGNTNGAIYTTWAEPGETTSYDPSGGWFQHGASFGSTNTSVDEGCVEAIHEFTPATAVTLRLYVFAMTGNYAYNAVRGYVTIEELPEYNVLPSEYIDQFALVETATNKRWIDGRVIYRKCFQLPDFSAGGTQTITTNITGTTANARPINAYGFGNNQSASNNWDQLGQGDGSATNRDSRITPASDLATIFIDTGSSINFGTDAILVFEYVK